MIYSKKLDVFIDYRSVQPGIHGGVTTVINAIVEFFASQKYQIVLLTNKNITTASQTPLPEVYYPQIAIRSTNYTYLMTGIKRFWYDAFELKKDLQKIQPLVAIFPDSHGIPSNLPNIQKILWLHDFIPLHFSDNIPLQDIPLYYFSIMNSLNNADLVVAISDLVKQEAIQRFHVNPHKIITIHDGLPLDKIKDTPFKTLAPNLLNKYGLQSKKYFVTFSNARKRKRLFYTVSLFHEISKNTQFKDFKLVIISKTRDQIKTSSSLVEYDRVIQFIHTNKLEERVIFAGSIDNDIKNTLMQQAYYSFFLSSDEGFGLPILESLAVETPVIASDIPVFHEIAQGFIDYVALDLSPQQGAKRCLEIFLNDGKRNFQIIEDYIRKNFDFSENLKALLPLLFKV